MAIRKKSNMFTYIDKVYSTIKHDITELYAYRNVLRSLVSKYLFGRYKNSYLGFLWHFIPPIIYMILCFLIFTELKDRSIDNYWFFLASGIFVFHFLTSSVVGGTSCFTGASGMIQKMYFPRSILVIAHAITSFIVMVVGYSIVIIFACIVGIGINPVALLYMLLLFILLMFFSIGCMLALSSIAVYVRDVHYFLSAMSIVLFVITPLRFMASTAQGLQSVIIWYNPFTYFVEAFHQILYFKQIPDTYYICVCMLLSVVAMIIGIIIYSKLRHGFVERL